jgi:hypothetical protein
MQLFRRRPSAAFVVAVFALCFALVGSAIAGTEASKKALSKSQVKKISKKQADKEINKKAGGLSVAHATSADTATSATSATTATNANSPSVYAHVNITGTSNPDVDESRSKGLTDADFKDVGSAGIYCVNLPSFKTFNAAVDTSFSAFQGGLDVIVVGDDGMCNAAGFGPANTIIEVVDTSAAPTGDDFDIQLGT